MSEKRYNSNIITRKSCRVCGNTNLENVLSLGIQKIINFADSSDKENLEGPMELVLCNKSNGGCGLVQLRHTISSELLYRTYWYKSGVNQTVRDALTEIVQKAQKLIDLKPNDIVLDVGANDGTLLRCYKTNNLKLIGFEPALNLVKEARVGTTEIINDFFNYEKFTEKFGSQKAKIITSIAMFYDLEDPNKFVSDVKKILDNDGIWIVQQNYLTTMLENNAFDNIVHEHLEYYSLKSLENLLRRHDMEIFEVELTDLNGGSFRTYIKHRNCKNYLTTKNVHDLRDYEGMIGLDDYKPYREFADRIIGLKESTHNFIKNEVKKGKKVYAYGASTRGNTLLQFYDLNNKLIRAVADRNPAKWGKTMVGTKIPVISEERARAEKPDYFLILPWYFIDEFKKREENYLLNGGKFIVPLPNFRLIESPDK